MSENLRQSENTRPTHGGLDDRLVRAPYPWFGGKKRVAAAVWERFGNVPNYVEPFFGSGAVLLGRPHPARTETINDLDAYVANFWRAIRHDPDAVARFADWPVNECDLHARHLWLVTQGKERIAALKADPDWYDAQVAGWWVWGLCAWIGDGWCRDLDSRRPHLANPPGQGINSAAGRTTQQRPRLSDDRVGVHAALTHQKRPSLSAGKTPRLGSRSRFGLHGPPVLGNQTHLGNGGRAIHSLAGKGGGIYDWFEALAVRLRQTRVCCGDWSRIVTPAVTTANGLTAVLLDPPYASHLRADCYTHDAAGLSARVRAWAVASGGDPLLRIAYCSYGEEECPPGWERMHWKTSGGYGNLSKSGRGRENAGRETIDFSPHCLRPGLFGDSEEDYHA